RSINDALNVMPRGDFWSWACIASVGLGDRTWVTATAALHASVAATLADAGQMDRRRRTYSLGFDRYAA
ncbi:hypothetical protein, partial [Xanthomonas euvesicatoria]|uniref:hypothetical protein n=1 Tax=Xanthomonas euvesicatoria TaxID=456327 RepID=UPI00062DA9AC